MGVEYIARANRDCIDNCEVLNGSNVTSVDIQDDGAWIVLKGNNGEKSLLLRNLGNNSPYFNAVRECVGRGACGQCVLAPYTKEAYIERGEFSETV